MELKHFPFSVMLFAALLASYGFAARQRDTPLQPARLELPKGNGAWAVRVIRSGGLATESSSDLTVSSLGELTCLPKADCSRRLTSDQIQAISVLATKRMSDSDSTINLACSHCFITGITLHHRDLNGKVRKYFAHWNYLTSSRVSQELVQLAKTIIQIAEQPLESND